MPELTSPLAPPMTPPVVSVKNALFVTAEFVRTPESASVPALTTVGPL